MTTRTTFLLNVPFPLLAPPSKLLKQAEQESPKIMVNIESAEAMEHSTYLSLQDSLVDLSVFTGQSAREIQIFCQEYGLWKMIGQLFHTSRHPSIALKVAALDKYLQSLRLPYLRVSRQTAAWIWGYLPQTPDNIHLDFEKSRRAATQSMKKLSVQPHQLNSFGSDETHHFFRLEVTTKLRTILDLLQFEDPETSLIATKAFLNDPDQEINKESLIRILKVQKHLQNRNRCFAVIEKIT